ncbi:MAG: mechanosensitive ion channel family protein [Pseudonocardia sp.]
MNPEPDQLVQPACVAEPGSWCARFYEWTDNDFLARSADTIVDRTLSITLIVVFALVARQLLHRAIRRFIDETIAGGRVRSALARRAPRRIRDAARPLVSARRSQRARTIGSILRSLSSTVVLVVALVMILAEFGVNLGPILASAGIVGVALGFGAQNVVRDFLSGIFILLEDQLGVGDVVDLGQASGTVEAVGLRITTVRDVHGTVWYVRNGEILRVGNKSQDFAVAVVDVPMGHGADLAEATELADRVARERVARDDLAADVLAPPEVLGVEKVATEGVTLRLTVRVVAGRQFAVQRALNAAVADAFDDAGLPTPGTPPAPAPEAGPPVPTAPPVPFSAPKRPTE